MDAWRATPGSCCKLAARCLGLPAASWATTAATTLHGSLSGTANCDRPLRTTGPLGQGGCRRQERGTELSRPSRKQRLTLRQGNECSPTSRVPTAPLPQDTVQSPLACPHQWGGGLVRIGLLAWEFQRIAMGGATQLLPNSLVSSSAGPARHYQRARQSLPQQGAREAAPTRSFSCVSLIERGGLSG